MQRYVIQLAHLTGDGHWHLDHGDSSLAAFDTRTDAESARRSRGKHLWDEGQPAQLMVHHADGSFEYGCSCGDDPQRDPG